MKYLILILFLLGGLFVDANTVNPYIDKIEATWYELQKIKQRKIKCERSFVRRTLNMCQYDNYLNRLNNNLNTNIVLRDQWDENNK